MPEDDTDIETREAVTSLAKFSYKPIGSLRIKGEVTDFAPDRKEVGGKFSFRGRWEPVTADLSLSGLVNDKGHAAAGQLVLRLSNTPVLLSSKVWAKLGLGTSHWRFGLELGMGKKLNGFGIDLRAFAERAMSGYKVGGKAALSYGSDTFRFSGGGQAVHDLHTGQTDYSLVFQLIGRF